MRLIRRGIHWWQSRIIWVNVLHGCFSGAVAVLPLLQAEMSLRVYAAVNVIVNGLLVGLRFATSDPIIVGKIREGEGGDAR